MRLGGRDVGANGPGRLSLALLSVLMLGGGGQCWGHTSPHAQLSSWLEARPVAASLLSSCSQR